MQRGKNTLEKFRCPYGECLSDAGLLLKVADSMNLIYVVVEACLMHSHIARISL